MLPELEPMGHNGSFHTLTILKSRFNTTKFFLVQATTFDSHALGADAQTSRSFRPRSKRWCHEPSFESEKLLYLFVSSRTLPNRLGCSLA